METDSSSSSFSLKGQDEAFSTRRDSIFGNLPVVQLETSRTIFSESQATTTSTNEEDESSDISSYKGEESMFKQPMPKLKKPSYKPRTQSFPMRSKHRVPDHKKNPQKWTKYSLASTSDITEKSNSAAAFSFLREIEERKRKENAGQEEDIGDEEGKVVFKKPKAKIEQNQEGKTYRDGKLVMPAFEFGAKKGSKHKSKDSVPSTSKRQNTQAAILSHLEEDVDDE